jgi:nicotinamidase-related amidase
MALSFRFFPSAWNHQMPDSAPMKDWMKLIPEADLATYRAGGFLRDLAFGERTALVVVDITLGFCGSPGLTLEQAIAEFPTACGPISWETMPRVGRLIRLFRDRGLPIVFTNNDIGANAYAGKATKGERATKPDPRFNDFPTEVAPRDGEWVLSKTKASGFFQTPLAAHLVRQRIDTVVVCGVSTSGCVRATAVDAYSHGFTTYVIDDCCFDRSWFAHCANLFDLQAKYASVVSLAELATLMSSARAPRAA